MSIVCYILVSCFIGLCMSSCSPSSPTTPSYYVEEAGQTFDSATSPCPRFVAPAHSSDTKRLHSSDHVASRATTFILTANSVDLSTDPALMLCMPGLGGFLAPAPLTTPNGFTFGFPYDVNHVVWMTLGSAPPPRPGGSYYPNGGVSSVSAVLFPASTNTVEFGLGSGFGPGSGHNLRVIPYLAGSPVGSGVFLNAITVPARVRLEATGGVFDEIRITETISPLTFDETQFQAADIANVCIAIQEALGAE